MAQKSLSEKLDELAGKARSLERQRSEAAAKIHTLEPEVDEVGALIAQANAKLDEMLKEGAIDDESQPTTADEAEEPMGFGGWPISPLIPLSVLEEHFPRASGME